MPKVVRPAMVVIEGRTAERIRTPLQITAGENMSKLRLALSASAVTLCLFLTTIFCVTTAVANPASESTVAADGTAVFNENGVNIREEPKLNGRILGMGQEGQEVRIVCTTDGDLIQGIATWYKITHKKTKVTGYVHYTLLRDVLWTNTENAGCKR